MAEPTIESRLEDLERMILIVRQELEKQGKLIEILYQEVKKINTSMNKEHPSINK